MSHILQIIVVLIILSRQFIAKDQIDDKSALVHVIVTWCTIGPVLCRHIASLDLNELRPMLSMSCIWCWHHVCTCDVMYFGDHVYLRQISIASYLHYLQQVCKYDVCMVCHDIHYCLMTQIAIFMGPTWGPPGADRTQVSPMLAPWTLLSGDAHYVWLKRHIVNMHNVP